MGLINVLIKAFILLLDLRDTFDALDTPKLDEIGRHERQVLVRNAQDGSKQSTTRRRIGTSKRKAAAKSALTTVLVWNLFHKMEPVCDRTIAWFVPFYDSFKTLFLIWMLFTRSYGASILVYRFLAPMVRPYEPIIGGMIELTLALFRWIASPLAPVVDRIAAFVRTISSAVSQSAPQPITTTVSTSASETLPQARNPPPDSVTLSAGEKAPKKPPPPSSPPATMQAPAPSLASKAGASTKLQPRTGPARARQVPVKKASQTNLAATRRVLQELPVPRHAFDSASPSLGTPAESVSTAPEELSGPSAAASTGSDSGVKKPVVKTEPLEPGFNSPAATQPNVLGPPPTPPTRLQNYAFIPGMTPQRSGPASLVSPTPRFPGGFSFSFAAPQASGSTSGNPFQAQARVPLTAQMAPLSISSPSTTPTISPGLLGPTASITSDVLTHKDVPSASDDRIVPPPNGTATIRKASSSRSLKGKATVNSTQATQTASRSSINSSSKKRSRPDDNEEEEGSELGSPTLANTSPRKRAKSAANKVTASKTAVGSAAAKARSKTKAQPTVAAGELASQTATAAPKRRTTVNGAQRSSNKSAAAESGTDGMRSASTATGEEPRPKSSGSPRKKATVTTDKTSTASKKPSTQRTTTKKASTTSKARSESVENAEASEPPPRLTRSRTKRNLAD